MPTATPPAVPPPSATPPAGRAPGGPVPVTRTFVQRIAAPPDRVFPLLCPVREAEWLDGWTAELLRSGSGVAEEGCVFRTMPPGEPETIWIVTRHEPSTGRVDFARVTAGLLATRLSLRVEGDGNGGSSVGVVYEFTPTSPSGSRLLSERHAEEAFRRSMLWWERSMNHFLATGQKLAAAAPVPQPEAGGTGGASQDGL